MDTMDEHALAKTMRMLQGILIWTGDADPVI